MGWTDCLGVPLICVRVCLSGVYILIAAGALMMVVGFLGCCGALKESPCMLGLVRSIISSVLTNRINCCIIDLKTIYKNESLITLPPPSLCFQFFFFLLVIFAVEVAAGVWGLSNKDKVSLAGCSHPCRDAVYPATVVDLPFLSLLSLMLHFYTQVVEDITEFYKQTYNNYITTKQDALRETLRVIHFGVSSHTQL